VVHWVVLGAHGPRAEEASRGAERFRAMAAGGEVTVMGFRDGFFPFEGAAIKEFFEDLKEELSPDLIFTHCPPDRHQDHRLVSDLTWNTWRDHTILEYEVPKWDGDLGCPTASSPSPGLGPRGRWRRSYPPLSQRGKPWFTADTFLGLMRLRGNECRAEEGFAEAFYARKLASALTGAFRRARGDGSIGIPVDGPQQHCAYPPLIWAPPPRARNLPHEKRRGHSRLLWAWRWELA
jgi:hypothetical protein